VWESVELWLYSCRCLPYSIIHLSVRIWQNWDDQSDEMLFILFQLQASKKSKFPVYSMKVYGWSRGISSCILHLATRWRWEFNFTPWPLHPGERTLLPIENEVKWSTAYLDILEKGICALNEQVQDNRTVYLHVSCYMFQSCQTIIMLYMYNCKTKVKGEYTSELSRLFVFITVYPSLCCNISSS